MSLEGIRSELHKAIDETDNEKLLQVMLTMLLENRMSDGNFLTDEQLNIIREREERYDKSEEQTKTLGDFKKEVNKKYGLLR